MTTQQTSFLSEILNGKPIPVGKLAYFRARLSNNLHRTILREFGKLSRDQKITKALLADRIGRKPEQVTRWLGAPSNLTLDTVSDLLLGMGYEPAVSLNALAEAKPSGSNVTYVPFGAKGEPKMADAPPDEGWAKMSRG